MDVQARREPGSTGTLTREGLGRLVAALWEEGREVHGPVARDGAICLDRVRSLDDLPAGLTDEQAPGHYRLVPSGKDTLFGFNAGPHAFKRSLLLPEVTLVRLRRSASAVEVLAGPPPAKKLAFLGVRACDLAALGVHDRVLREGPHADSDYAARRSDVLIIAVQCGKAGGTCFCASMKTGPRATAGFDLALTEIAGPPHRFFVEVGSAAGAALAERIGLGPAAPEDRAESEAMSADVAAHMGRALDTAGLRERLQENPEDPRWADVATRCLGCTSCTMVCPTCFCTTVEDRTDLTGTEAERSRRYDSCFSEEFAYVHGGSVRPSLRARYRQWLTHKLSTWIDQFGSSGCVGCGRCITFCPVGIDITAEAAAVGRPAAPRREKE
jgi:ferredoxin